MKKLTFTLRAVKIVALLVMVLMSGWAWAQDGKITICHCPPGNLNNCHSITISVNAWYAHLTHHDDYIGACTDNPNRKLIEVVVSPNPSYEQTTITYVLLEESHVVINAYNSMGIIVATIVNENQAAGTYTQTFTAPTSGIYLLSVMAETPYEAVDNSQTVIETK